MSAELLFICFIISIDVPRITDYLCARSLSFSKELHKTLNFKRIIFFHFQSTFVLAQHFVVLFSCWLFSKELLRCLLGHSSFQGIIIRSYNAIYNYSGLFVVVKGTFYFCGTVLCYLQDYSSFHGNIMCHFQCHDKRCLVMSCQDLCFTR